MPDASLSGSLQRLTGSIALNSPPTLVLSGALTRPTSSITLATEKTLSLAGSLTRPTSSFTLVGEKMLAFDASLQPLTASVTLVSQPNITLDATLRPLTASVTFVSQPNITLDASLPSLTGEFQVNRTIVLGVTQTLTFTAPDGYPQIVGPMEVVIADDVLDRAPTTVQVSVSNAAELDSLTFTIDGVQVFVESSDVDGFLDATSIPVPEEVGTSGIHTLTVTSTVKGSSAATFTLDRGAAAHPATKAADADPILVPASVDGDRFHWVLQDLAPGGLGSWVMPVSPTTMSNPHFRRDVTVQHTTAIAGTDHVFEGHMPPLDWQFAGFCPDQAFYNQLRAYMNLNRRFYVIDHRGRAWTVAPIGVELRPRKRQSVNGALSDWHHDYTATFALLDQDWKEPV